MHPKNTSKPSSPTKSHGSSQRETRVISTLEWHGREGAELDKIGFPTMPRSPLCCVQIPHMDGTYSSHWIMGRIAWNTDLERRNENSSPNSLSKVKHPKVIMPFILPEIKVGWKRDSWYYSALLSVALRGRCYSGSSKQRPSRPSTCTCGGATSL